MPRPKLKSDDEVLEAATVVLKRCGPIEFTLSGVAKEVGLSRAALIQRFTNRDTLLVRMMERGVEQVRHYLNAIPIGAGPQGLWEFLQAEEKRAGKIKRGRICQRNGSGSWKKRFGRMTDLSGRQHSV